MSLQAHKQKREAGELWEQAQVQRRRSHPRKICVAPCSSWLDDTDLCFSCWCGTGLHNALLFSVRRDHFDKGLLSIVACDQVKVRSALSARPCESGFEAFKTELWFADIYDCEAI